MPNLIGEQLADTTKQRIAEMFVLAAADHYAAGDLRLWAASLRIAAEYATEAWRA